MSETIDANVLVYASNVDDPHHGQALAWLAGRASSQRLITVLWPVVSAYVRISTHPNIFTTPLTLAQARHNMDDLLSRPHVRTVSEEPGFWRHLDRALTEVSARGNLVTDTHLVALMRQHGIDTIWTADRDFRRFEGLSVRNPFA